MRKFVISLAAAASALAFAAPASAQWVVPTYRYAPYNYAYGYNGLAFAHAMQARVQRIRYDIRNMAARRILSYREARSLDYEARTIERRIYRAPRNGIRPAEARGIENRIRRLERHVAREARDWDGRIGRYRRY
jgi:hypothetical protein